MTQSKSVIFVGQAYYNAWVLRNSLRDYKWNTLLLNIDPMVENNNYYHGSDLDLFKPDNPRKSNIVWQLELYLFSLLNFKIFHFSNMGGISFIPRSYSNTRKSFLFISGRTWKKFIEFIYFKLARSNFRMFVRFLRASGVLNSKNGKHNVRFGFRSFVTKLYEALEPHLREHWDIYFLKELGVKVSYANNACQDGVLQSSFEKWKPFNSCSICSWKDQPLVCSDEKNRKWGQFRNSVTDYQMTLGSNRADFNDSPLVHEVPEFYCLDSKHWKASELIPSNYKLPIPEEVFKIYHSVGNFDSRTNNGVNIKCTHIYLEIIERLKKEGHKVELVFLKDIKNTHIKFYLQQIDIVVDMLTFGFFGANIREALMLGKPAVCYLRPEWLERMKEEVPDYVNELPVISATMDTAEEVIKRLMTDKVYYDDISKRSKEFAMKYHSDIAAANKLDEIYSELICE